GRRQEARDLRRSEALVSQAAQRRQPVGAVLDAARRHVRLLVPGQHRSGPLEVRDLAQYLPQPLQARTSAKRRPLVGWYAACRRHRRHAGTLRLRRGGAAGCLGSRPAASRMGRRCCPVYELGSWATCSGVPSATSRPPRSPPSGPRSISQSAVFSTSRLCSITITVFPWSTRRCRTFSSLSTSK